MLSPSTTMTTSMGRADLANYHHRNLCEHDALVVIVATERFALPSLRISREKPPPISTHGRVYRRAQELDANSLQAANTGEASFPSQVAKRTQPQGLK